MRTNLVVVSTIARHASEAPPRGPSLQLFFGIRKCQEPKSVQTLLPELAVERLYEGIIGWFSWAREAQCDVIDLGPKVKVAGDKFAAIIDTYGLGISDLPANPFQGMHHIFTATTEPRISCWAEPGMDVDDCQNA